MRPLLLAVLTFILGSLVVPQVAACPWNHGQVPLRFLLPSRPESARAAKAEALADSIKKIDSEFCNSLHPLDPQFDQARRIAQKMADLFAIASQEVTQEGRSPVQFESLFTHVEETPFTRVLCYWKELGLKERQVIRLLEVARKHRQAYNRHIKNAEVALRDSKDSSQVAQQPTDRLKDIYLGLLNLTIDTVGRGYSILTADQKSKLLVLYKEETGHSLFNKGKQGGD